MEYHLLILNGSNESFVCRYLLKGWDSSVPVVVLYSSKGPEDLSDLQLESASSLKDSVDPNFKESSTDLSNYKYSLLYKELNRVNSLSKEEFETLLSNLLKYLKTVLFRPLLLLFRKNNDYKPSVLFNTKSVLSYYFKLNNLPGSHDPETLKTQEKVRRGVKDLLYWYIEFDYNYSLVGNTSKLVKLLEDLEDSLELYNLDDKLTQLLLSLLNMYIDGLVFRNISLAKYTRILKYTKLYSPTFNAFVSNSREYLTQTLSRGDKEGRSRDVHAEKGSSEHTSGTHHEETPATETSAEAGTSDQSGEKELSLSEYKKLFLENKKPYHIASAISYTNGYPHLGHAYEGVVCDAISRYYKMFGRGVIFSTGTDEHGIKVMNTAKAQNKRPIEICDYYSNEFKKMYKKLLVEYDRFIRTTSLEHIRAAKTIWRRVYRKGDIYLGKYNGYYSVREERFIPNTEAKLTDFKDPVSGKPYDLMSENSFFFTMERYRKKLVNHITTNPDFIFPLKSKNEILARLKEPLEDLSISRTSFDWGIEIPTPEELMKDLEAHGHSDKAGQLKKHGHPSKANHNDVLSEKEVKEILSLNNDVNVGYNEDTKLFNETKFYNMHNNVPKRQQASAPAPSASAPAGSCASHATDTSASPAHGPDSLSPKQDKHVMYVWFDALSFYMTASGLGESFEEMTHWPTDLQVIGKDISWFQSVILGTMCLSMEVPLTRRILAHGFIQGADGRKMSKSLGNVLNLDDLLKDVGVESFRYYLLKSTVLGSDVNFDLNQLKEMYNSDLADNVGNLVHRLTSLVAKYNGGVVPEYKLEVPAPVDLAEFVRQASGHVHRLDLYSLLNLVSARFKDLNNFTTTHAPWAEKNADKRDSVLRVLLESVYFLGHLLFPVLPESGEHLFRKLGTPRRDHVWQLSFGLDNLDSGSKVSVGDVLYQKFTATQPTTSATTS